MPRLVRDGAWRFVACCPLQRRSVLRNPASWSPLPKSRRGEYFKPRALVLFVVPAECFEHQVAIAVGYADVAKLHGRGVGADTDGAFGQRVGR